MRSKLGLCIIALLAVMLVACGGGSSSGNGGGGGGGQPPTLQSIAITPGGPLTVGTDQQFTATGHYSDGSTKDLTASATWASSDSTIATISSPGGKAHPVKHGTVTITGTSGGVDGTVDLTVNAVLQSISVSPIGPAVVIGSHVAFAATGSFNDGTQSDVTSATSFSSSAPSIASFSANVATGVAAGAAAVTATDGSATANTSINVVTTAIPGLSGPYAFTLVGADSRGNQFYAGSFTADGNGNITGGIEDANTGSEVSTSIALSGTYSMYPDGRGSINFASNTIHPNGLTLRFILASTGAAGKLVEFDGAGSLKGEFKVQSPSDVLQSGKYVFLTSGPNASGGKLQEIGIFTSDGANHITAGKLDANDAGTITAAANLTPSTYGDPVSNGRGTLTISTASVTQNYAYYVVDSTRINLIQTDASPNSALGGFAELQSGVSSNDGDLNGSFSFLLEHPMLVGDPNLRGEFGIMGHLEFDGTGGIGLNGIQDEHHNFRITYSGISGTYNISGANARGVLTEIITIPDSLTETHIFYMISPQKMVMLHTQNGNNAVVTPDAGVALQQSPTFDDTTLDGTYALSGSELAGSNTEVLGAITFDGTGGISGVLDISQNGALSSKILNVSYRVVPDANSGRGEFGPAGNTPDPLTDYLIYVISPSKAWSVGADQPDLKPDTMGSLDLQ